MHGRIKVRTTEEQKEAKRKEQQAKLEVYKKCVNKVFTKREIKEYDEESLALTREILQKNPDFYTIWNFRRETLLFLKADKSEDEVQKYGVAELDLTEVCLQKNPKSYSTWEHRCWSMEYMPKPNWNRELVLCKAFLRTDERNFHCYDYRRYVAKKCNVKPIDELEFTTDLIETNFSNYSAWHYRSKLLPIVHPGSVPGTVNEDTMLKEYEIVQNAAFTDPNDQSVWFYHRWLLGRKKEAPKVIIFAVLPQQQLAIVLFSSAVLVNDETLKLFVNDSEVDVVWIAVDEGAKASLLWFCQIHEDVKSFGEGSKVSLQAILKGQKNSSCCVIDGNRCSKSQIVSNSKVFCADISAATKDVLEKELESCEQLYELEPDNKWTLFTCVLLMRAIDRCKYETTISKYLDQLLEVDSMRTNYYRDLKSKFLVENYIEDMPDGENAVIIAKKGLTSLHHFQHFCLVKEVNLASNSLSKVYQLRYLLCIETLILDENELEDCRDIKDLRNLKKLSLKRNNIEHVSCLQPLTSCKALENVYLHGNPVTELASFKLEIKNICSKIDFDTNKQ